MYIHDTFLTCIVYSYNFVQSNKTFLIIQKFSVQTVKKHYLDNPNTSFDGFERFKKQLAKYYLDQRGSIAVFVSVAAQSVQKHLKVSIFFTKKCTEKCFFAHVCMVLYKVS
eukprot:TRINITY_DN3904_c0_g3_i1.p7 TRINITY_DN3904_c0_g3~~TRINITY_DN3904_c0_g3_i1.p7  ORF type:complete len:111 (-),score=4.89 TRINITY_DN3904_c0_g3_i1:894-1226(-)